MSVVIPAYNCQRTLPRCLSSLMAQTYPRARFELIVVDDGSTDATAARALKAVRRWGGRFQLVRQTNGGPARARNAGIRAARGEIVAFIDADCTAERDWLQQIAASLEAHADAAGVGGPLELRAAGSLVASYLGTTAFYRHRLRRGQVDYLLTANAGFRREALRRVGGFAEEWGAWCEDADLSFRLRDAGYSLLLAQEGGVSILEGPQSVRALASKLFRYGHGSAVLSRRWGNGRSPAVELLRHAGAVALSPALALRLAPRVGLGRALAFWPLIAVEHTAFVCGLAAGTLRGCWGGRRRGAGSAVSPGTAHAAGECGRAGAQ
ncbi:MAG TPA: glycosyltransferase [Ktedonobacterales bacterium]